jgi:hypothetical protein
MDPAVRITRLIEIWEGRVGGESSWVLFQNGTCVLCRDPELDPVEYARGVLSEWGPVVPGTPLGDFNYEIQLNPAGILVTYSHPDVFTFVLAEEMEDPDSPLGAALAARYSRGEDAEDLNIVYKYHNH